MHCNTVNNHEMTTNTEMADDIMTMLDRIIKAVHHLNEEQQQELLTILETWQSGKQRDYRRLDARTDIDVVVGDRVIQTTTRNMSASGIYINTAGKFEPNKDVRVVFSVPGYDKPFKLKGRIIRVEQHGLAIRFEQITSYFKQILDDVIWKETDQAL